MILEFDAPWSAATVGCFDVEWMFYAGWASVEFTHCRHFGVSLCEPQKTQERSRLAAEDFGSDLCHGAGTEQYICVVLVGERAVAFSTFDGRPD